MATTPLLDQAPAGRGTVPASLAHSLADGTADRPEIDLVVAGRNATRRFSVYQPMAAFHLVEELSHLSRRAIDANVFLSPQFLVPAMPRLDDRRVRLVVVRDEAGGTSRLRLLMPFSVERAGVFGGTPVIRAWTHPFGPLGTLPIDSDDPGGVLRSLLETLGRPELGLPGVLVLPDLRVDEPMWTLLGEVASRMELARARANRFSRAALLKADGAEAYLGRILSGRRRRELERQGRILKRLGPVTFTIARERPAVRLALEDFLMLEGAGWKGRERSAMIRDRVRSAFAREAIDALAAEGRVRIFGLNVGTRLIASLIVFVENGEAFAWKTAYDEAFAKASPGQQIVAEATRALLADPSVKRVDSCAMPDHFVMNRFWKGRITLETAVIGLRPGSKARVASVAASLARAHRLRNRMRLLRGRARSLVGLS